MAIKQEGRLCRISSPLGEDALFVQEFDGHEGMSQLFRFTLTLVSTDNAVDFSEIIGQPVTVTIDLADGSSRFFHGIVAGFAQTAADLRVTTYRADVVPWLWLLTRRADCRIYQDKTVPEIVSDVFDRAGFSDYELKLNGTYDPLVNCVQYRETDFQFVSRLLESAGIFYYFRHEDGRHTLVLADAASHNQPVPGQETAKLELSPDSQHDEDHVETWRAEQVLQPGKYALTDYNFIDPGTDLLVGSASAINVGNNAGYEIYDYPGAYVNLGGENDGKLGKGDAVVQIRREEGDCGAVLHSGVSGCRAFATGYHFELAGHTRADYNASYLLIRIDHALTQSGNLVSGAEVNSTYSNTFTCIPRAVTFRPERATPRPRVNGPQTAVVTGPSGEEIYVDKHGRVKVAFHWDRESAGDGSDSGWIRVAHGWAGAGWGMQFTPRIGHEVVVEFLEGDPDQPLITGSVYNGKNAIPFSTPTQSGVRSRSSKEASAANCNEIRFEDKKGEEDFFQQAERTLTVNVKDSSTKTVGTDQSVSVGKSRTLDVAEDETVTVGRDQSVTVGRNQKVVVGENRDDSVGKDESHAVGGKQTESIGSGRNVSIGKDDSLNVGGGRSASIGKNDSLNVDGNYAVDAGKDGLLKTGKTLTLEAADSITIKVGKASLTLKKDGTITLDGKDITVKGSGKINIKASADVTIKGSKVQTN